MNRRDLLTLLGGAAASWPIGADAQGAEHVPLVGVLSAMNEHDAVERANLVALQRSLQEGGWVIGRNLRIEWRWSGGNTARLPEKAKELVSLSPDVIVAGFGPTTPTLQAMTSKVPIVMAQAIDPVGAGFVDSLSRPKGNITGFIQFEYTLSGKWLELLREIAPAVSRIGVVRDIRGPVGIGLWAVIQASASPLKVELRPINLAIGGSVEGDLANFAGPPNSGLIVGVSTRAAIERDLIVEFAARHRLPAIYYNRMFAQAGGLMSYGPDLAEGYRQAAGYVQRILRGEKPADLPVQAPTKYQLVINVKTARALGITVPPTLLARADEVIE